MHNSASINLNILDACFKRNIKRIFYSSSRMYPAHNQVDPHNPNCEKALHILLTRTVNMVKVILGETIFLLQKFWYEV